MYCDRVDSTRRRATQTAMHRVFDSMVRLIAPILAFTADEAWEHAGHKNSVHLETFPEADPAFAGSEASDQIEALINLRDLSQVSIDAAVKSALFKKREQASVTFAMPADDPAKGILETAADDVLEFLMISKFSVGKTDRKSTATVQVTDHAECPRCRRSIETAPDSELCVRCDEAMS
jgi:isoleucyl-tRNA synthetase